MAGGRRWASFLTGQPDPETPPGPGGESPAEPAPHTGEEPVAVGARRPPRPARYPSAPPVDEPVHQPDAVGDEGYDEYLYDDEGYEEYYDDELDDGEWVRYPRRSAATLRFVIVGAVALLGVLFVRSWIAGWVDGQVTPSGPVGDELEFTIEEGWPTNRVAEELVSEGVIDNSTVFRYWLRCPGLAKTLVGLDCEGETEANFRAGDYLLNENMAYPDVVEVLNAGPIPPEFRDVTIPEGLRFTQMIDRLVDENPEYDPDEMADAFRDSRLTSRFLPEGQVFKWMEGLLFPATYQIDEDHIADELDILVRMAETMEQRFDAAVDEVGRAPEIDQLGLSEYELLIIASLIEEEAKVPDERPKMARVIYNRLLQGEPLGIDASLLYAYPPGTDPNSLNHAEDESEYNLRNRQGLPPTPISGPGSASIEAALAPEPGDWLFYVLVDEDGTHAFAVTNAEHEANVAICRERGLC